MTIKSMITSAEMPYSGLTPEAPLNLKELYEDLTKVYEKHGITVAILGFLRGSREKFYKDSTKALFHARYQSSQKTNEKLFIKVTNALAYWLRDNGIADSK